MVNKTAVGAGAAIIVIAAIGAGYEYTKYQKYVSSGGTLSFTQWLGSTPGSTITPTPTPSTTGTPPGLTPTLSCSVGVLASLAGSSGTSFQTTDNVTFTGTDYTPNSTMYITDSLGQTSEHATDANGAFNSGSFPANTITLTTQTITFTGVDSTTGVKSNVLTCNITAPGSLSGGSTTFGASTSTTSPGNVLPATAWTWQGTQGSNTNPVPFGMWAIFANGAYGAQSTVNAGYYITPGSNGAVQTETYFANVAAAQAWLNAYNTANGYELVVVNQNNPVGTPTVQTSGAGSASSPYMPNPNTLQQTYYGTGYYMLLGSGVAENWANYQNMSLYNAVLNPTATFINSYNQSVAYAQQAASTSAQPTGAPAPTNNASVTLSPASISKNGTWSFTATYSGFKPNVSLMISAAGYSLSNVNTNSSGSASELFNSNGGYFTTSVLPYLNGSIEWAASDGTNTSTTTLTVT